MSFISLTVWSIRAKHHVPYAPRLFRLSNPEKGDYADHPLALYGAARFVEMARAYSGCEVWHQDFLRLELPQERFDGVFANASLFHVPRQELPRVLNELRSCLTPRGVLFSSNPRGQNEEGWMGGRYGEWHADALWRDVLIRAGFSELEHYYRPPGVPRARQAWLASVWRKAAS